MKNENKKRGAFLVPLLDLNNAAYLDLIIAPVLLKDVLPVHLIV